MNPENYIQVVESEVETSYSDDSQEQPSLDILEETQSRFSDLSIQKKSRSRVHVEGDEDVGCKEIATLEFDANDEKSFEIVQKIIEGGQFEKLKVEQCKLYIRKHGLRLAGKKEILINRIKEHISLMNGEGEHKYPASSFVMNCKGDACTGDIVMFEQNVYEMFSIASRSATGPPCGTRVVAGRIVKESYGAAKQQHTFTIEVLWSKGVKPLPPLHPLLIKGRNLYRLKTMRQRWEDESQRHKILSEKHARGNAARSNRETRLHEKEKKKALRESRTSKGNIQNEKQETKRMTSPTHTMLNSTNNPPKHDFQKTSIQFEGINLPAKLNPYAGPPSTGVQPLMNMTYNHHSHKENIIFNSLNPLIREPNGPLEKAVRFEQNMGFYPSTKFERYDYDVREIIRHPRGPLQNYNFQQGNNNGHLPRTHSQGQRQQLCRYYAQGRCHFGTNCKYLH